MIALLLLVVFVVVCKSIDTSIDTTSISSLNADISINERNLNLNTHHELAPLYDRGDPRVTRRKLTHAPARKPPTPSKPTPSKPTTSKPTPSKPTTSKPTPSKPTKPQPKPTKTFKPSTRSVSTRSPTNRPTIKPTIKAPTTAGNSIIPPGIIFKDATDLVYVVNTATQYTTYKADGTCTTWPYYAPGNVFMTVAKTYKLSKTGTTIDGTDMSDSSKTIFTILDSNPHANKCINSKSNFNTFSNILDTFKQGDKYQDIDDQTKYW